MGVGFLRGLHVTYPPLYIIGGIALWAAVFESGVHATIAGVAMGLLAPATPLQNDLQAERIVDVLENRQSLTAEEVRATAGAIKESVSACDRLVELLHPWTSYVIVPVFALANAGISLDATPFDHRDVFLGVLLGLVVGKTLGIAGFAWLATRTSFAALPAGVSWMEFVATAAVAGIGFTVSLFITGLAFTDEALAQSAKVGILLASALAAALGVALFLASARRRRLEPEVTTTATSGIDADELRCFDPPMPPGGPVTGGRTRQAPPTRDDRRRLDGRLGAAHVVRRASVAGIAALIGPKTGESP